MHKYKHILLQIFWTIYLASVIATSIVFQVGYDVTKNAAEKVYKKSGVFPKDVDVIELHDCFSANELITYEALGLCEPGMLYSFVYLHKYTYIYVK